MHIGPGFLSPAVWASTAAVSGAALAASLAVANRRLDDRRVVLMGVMGAFVFAAQMVNFPVLPGTSGHLGGGFLLGVLMASILVVQALVFQDGGVEALGANILVMGVIPALVGAAVRRLWRRRAGLLADAATFLGGLVAVLIGATTVIVLLRLSAALPGSVSLWQAIAVMDLVHLLLKTRPEAVFAGPGGRMEAASA